MRSKLRSVISVWPSVPFETNSLNALCIEAVFSNASYSADVNPTSQQGSNLNRRQPPNGCNPVASPGGQEAPQTYWRSATLQSPPHADSNTFQLQSQLPLQHLSGNRTVSAAWNGPWSPRNHRGMANSMALSCSKTFVLL